MRHGNNIADAIPASTIGSIDSMLNATPPLRPLARRDLSAAAESVPEDTPGTEDASDQGVPGLMVVDPSGEPLSLPSIGSVGVMSLPDGITMVLAPSANANDCNAWM